MPNRPSASVHAEPAIRLVLSRLPATLELALVALTLSILIGLPPGLAAPRWWSDARNTSRPRNRLGHVRVVFGHILPNCLAPVIVIARVQTAHAVSLEATLSFLGVGLPQTEASLGVLIANGFQYLLSGSYWISLFPGLALLLTIVSINLNRLDQSQLSRSISWGTGCVTCSTPGSSDERGIGGRRVADRVPAPRRARESGRWRKLCGSERRGAGAGLIAAGRQGQPRAGRRD